MYFLLRTVGTFVLLTRSNIPSETPPPVVYFPKRRFFAPPNRHALTHLSFILSTVWARKMSGAYMARSSSVRAFSCMRGAWASLSGSVSFNSMASLSLQGALPWLGGSSGSGILGVAGGSLRFYSMASRSGVSSVSSGIPFRSGGSGAAPFMNSRVMMSTFATEYDAHVRLVLC